ncbi:MAG TPA: sugar transferase [Verrucomicrobiae bacterium]|nr:sugar transferase [Verrucomicrobiae bacterium]
MNEARRNFLLNALKLFDLGLLVVSYGLATVVIVSTRRDLSLSQYLSMRVKVSNFAIFLAMVLAWHLVFAFSGMYGSKRLSTRRSILHDAFRATSFCVISLSLAALLFTITMVTPRFLLLFWILSFSLVSSGRLLLREFLGNVRRRGRNLRYMLILGTNQRALEFAASIESRPELGYRVLGFADDYWPAIDAFHRSGRALVCDFKALPEFLRHNVVDEIANYLPLRSFYEHTSQVAALCELHGIILRFNTDLFGLKTARPQAAELEGRHYITYSSGIRDTWPLLIKRSVDIFVSLSLLILLGPLFLLAAALIKWTSVGPVFFLQERIGYNKRRFRIYKFRTMVPGAEKMMTELERLNEVSGPVFKIKNDPRITPLGKFLRRASIDELPQLINVLKGEMSLVGPRPLPVRDYQGFSEDWQRRRFSVRPGITCLWQVKGRSSITFEQWMRLDMQYLDEWSLWLDMKILARTIPAVLRGSGAV